MKKPLFLTAALLLAPVASAAGEPAPFMTNVGGRAGQRLNGSWRIIVDPFEQGFYDYRYKESANGYFKDKKMQNKAELIEYDFDTSPTLYVPGDWNSQRDDLFFYEGTVWYRRTFDHALPPGRRLFVHFGAANYHAIVYFNGEKLGEHIGGFTPFQFEITSKVRATGNFLVVKVDNKRLREAVPTVNTDWWNYGGLTRDVDLVETPATYIKDYSVQLKKGARGTLAGWVQVDGPDPSQTITLTLPGLNLTHTCQTDRHGRAEFSLQAEPKLWSPETPIRYEVSLASSTDRISEKIGFRTIETRGKDIVLNGKPVFLRGICIHEESPLRPGRATGLDDARVLLGWAKDLGCNFVRLAHYPHNESMVRMADEMGLLVWSEIPVYWTITWENKATYANAENQLVEMIARDKNRASVILWSLANETPVSEPRTAFLASLAKKARELDNTRLLTAANERKQHGNRIVVDDPFGEHLDVLGCNEYFGWYVGLPETCDNKTWEVLANKPLIISEFGAEALLGLHADKDTRWCEEFQASVYEHQIGMLKKIDHLRGVSPWILKDFRSPRRARPVMQDYWNRKGLVSDRGERKLAFEVLREYYFEIEKRESAKE